MDASGLLRDAPCSWQPHRPHLLLDRLERALTQLRHLLLLQVECEPRRLRRVWLRSLAACRRRGRRNGCSRCLLKRCHRWVAWRGARASGRQWSCRRARRCAALRHVSLPPLRQLTGLGGTFRHHACKPTLQRRPWRGLRAIDTTIRTAAGVPQCCGAISSYSYFTKSLQYYYISRSFLCPARKAVKISRATPRGFTPDTPGSILISSGHGSTPSQGERGRGAGIRGPRRCQPQQVRRQSQVSVCFDASALHGVAQCPARGFFMHEARVPAGTGVCGRLTSPPRRHAALAQLLHTAAPPHRRTAAPPHRRTTKSRTPSRTSSSLRRASRGPAAMWCVTSRRSSTCAIVSRASSLRAASSPSTALPRCLTARALTRTRRAPQRASVAHSTAWIPPDAAQARVRAC
jgi:hypothetical protein